MGPGVIWNQPAFGMPDVSGGLQSAEDASLCTSWATLWFLDFYFCLCFSVTDHPLTFNVREACLSYSISCQPIKSFRLLSYLLDDQIGLVWVWVSSRLTHSEGIHMAGQAVRSGKAKCKNEVFVVAGAVFYRILHQWLQLTFSVSLKHLMVTVLTVLLIDSE